MGEAQLGRDVVRVERIVGVKQAYERSGSLFETEVPVSDHSEVALVVDATNARTGIRCYECRVEFLQHRACFTAFAVVPNSLELIAFGCAPPFM